MTPDASWTFAPGILLALALVLGLYLTAWRRARGARAGHRPSPWRLASFLAGLLAVFAALISPIDALADDVLAIHMTQHVLLLDIAPILCLLGLTKVILRPVTRRLRELERRAGVIGSPVFALVAYVGVMWLWHVPTLYDAASRHEALHAFEHLTFMLAGGLYWWHLLSPIRSRMRLPGMGPIVYMVASKFGLGMLGILLTFAPDALYPAYDHTVWGMTGREDQALAGAIMAIEQSIVMGIALAWLFARMLGESEREQQRAERYEPA